MLINFCTVKEGVGGSPRREPEKEKCHSVLYLIRQTGIDIHNTMALKDDEKDKITALFRKFDESVLPNDT